MSKTIKFKVELEVDESYVDFLPSPTEIMSFISEGIQNEHITVTRLQMMQRNRKRKELVESVVNG